MADQCIFCKIISKEIPSKMEHEDDLCVAFHDIHPRSRVHLLVLPKRHMETLKDMEIADEKTLGRMMKVASDLAKKFKLEDYKLLMSVGKKAGQEIFHAHLHVMSVD
ncbi:MAG: HIT domain-containing protein [Candidatus Gracilibacteria bacterium]